MDVTLNALSDIELLSDAELVSLINHAESFDITGLVDESSPIRKLAMLHYGQDNGLQMMSVCREINRVAAIRFRAIVSGD